MTRVSPTVVQIETAQGLGSGIVYDADGDVVTNAHVTSGATRFDTWGECKIIRSTSEYGATSRRP